MLDTMSGHTTPPSSQEAEIKRESSASPDLPQQSIPEDAATERSENQNLLNSMARHLANDTKTELPVNNAATEIPERSYFHEGSSLAHETSATSQEASIAARTDSLTPMSSDEESEDEDTLFVRDNSGNGPAET